MVHQKVARGTPMTLRSKDPAREPAQDEPVLRIDNIQGNIIGGFNKDHQTLVFLKVHDVERFRAWLRGFVPFVATSAEVVAFNRLFKEINSRRGVETGAVESTWVNIALSFGALLALTKDGKLIEKNAERVKSFKGKFGDGKAFAADAFADEAFKQGLARRAVDELADPKDPGAEGNPANWVFGGPGHEADVVITVAGDDAGNLAAEVARIEDSLYSGRTLAPSPGGGGGGGPTPTFAGSGATVVYKQHGHTLPPPLVGHEHFGFLDGVSQPGLRGRLSDSPTDLLTLRQNPNDPDQGKPGQDLLWPGEFVFGYPGQDAGAADITVKGPDSLREAGPNKTPVGPAWAQDGSFLVIRRLRQDVGGFHAFLEEQEQKLGTPEGLFGAKLVGRWKSGAPVVRAPDKDNPPLADDDCANNHFEFQEDGEPIHAQPDKAKSGCTVDSSFCTDDQHPQAKADPAGAVCPFAAHIRKTYPRDDTGDLSPAIGEVSTQTHRLLRRGIPFGEPFYPPKDPNKSRDTGDRGLVFAAYQTSITDQFEFVQASWSNNADFKDKRKSDGTPVAGHDLIIGQSNDNGSRERRCRVTVTGPDGKLTEHTVVAPADWVIPTGGGYFFAPSIDALCLLSGRERSDSPAD